MARNCYLMWNHEGILVCSVNHRNQTICEMYEKLCEHGYPEDECEEES